METAKIQKFASFSRKSELPKNRRGWHFDKSVNLPFLLSLAIFCIGALAYIMEENKRTTKAEEKIVNLEKNDIQLTNQLKELKYDIKEDLKEIKNTVNQIKDRR